jgi:hypothetical protein
VCVCVRERETFLLFCLVYLVCESQKLVVFLVVIIIL